MQMLQMLFAGVAVPADAKLLLATTKGEIDLLEQSMLEERGNAADAIVSRLVGKVARPDRDKGRRGS